MVKLVENGLIFMFVDLSQDLGVVCEFLMSRSTGEILTYPMETILNCVADVTVLTSIAIELSVEPTEDNLEDLFESITGVYDQSLSNINNVA